MAVRGRPCRCCDSGSRGGAGSAAFRRRRTGLGLCGAFRRHAAFDRHSSAPGAKLLASPFRSEEHTSELQSLMRISYAVFCLKKKKKVDKSPTITTTNQQYILYYL